MKKLLVDQTAKIVDSVIGKNAQIREYCAIHDSMVGEGCRIYERSSIKKVKMGKKVDVNAGTYIEFADIEDGVQIGPNCSVVGVFHKLTKKGVERKDTFRKIEIKKGAFLGAGCIILPGRVIGEGAVIGAGAIITENIPSFHIAVGIPPNQTIKSLKERLSWR